MNALRRVLALPRCKPRETASRLTERPCPANAGTLAPMSISAPPSPATPHTGRLSWLPWVLRALAPSRWALAALVLFVGLRLVGWHLT